MSDDFEKALGRALRGMTDPVALDPRQGLAELERTARWHHRRNQAMLLASSLIVVVAASFLLRVNEPRANSLIVGAPAESAEAQLAGEEDGAASVAVDRDRAEASFDSSSDDQEVFDSSVGGEAVAAADDETAPEELAAGVLETATVDRARGSDPATADQPDDGEAVQIETEDGPVRDLADDDPAVLSPTALPQPTSPDIAETDRAAVFESANGERPSPAVAPSPTASSTGATRVGVPPAPIATSSAARSQQVDSDDAARPTSTVTARSTSGNSASAPRDGATATPRPRATTVPTRVPTTVAPVSPGRAAATATVRPRATATSTPRPAPTRRPTSVPAPRPTAPPATATPTVAPTATPRPTATVRPSPTPQAGPRATASPTATRVASAAVSAIAPLRCSALLSGPNVSLAWEPAPGDNATHYVPIWNYTTGGRDSHEHFAYIDASNTSAAFTGPNDDAGFWSIRTVASRGPGAGLSVDATPCRSETRGLMPLAPVGCRSRVDGGATTISWTPADGDAADRYVIYARSTDENSIRWVTSVEADEASYTHDDFADPSSYAWLVKTRTTSADGKRYFTDGVLCAGSSVEYIPGDTRAKAVRLAGGAERFSGSLINASLEPGEQAVTFPSDGPCRAHRDATGRTVGSLTGSVWAELEMASTNATAYEFELSAPWGAQVAVYAAPVGSGALRQLGCSALTSWNSDGAKVNVNLEAGGRYLVQIFGQSWPSGVSDPTHAGPSGQWSAPGTGAFTLSLRPV